MSETPSEATSLARTTLTRHLAVRPDWLARHEEPILEPDLPIIDPHHHLWERSDNLYMPGDLLADMDSGQKGHHNIVGTVFVQCYAFYNPATPTEYQPVGEIEVVNGMAALDASHARRRGVFVPALSAMQICRWGPVSPPCWTHNCAPAGTACAASATQVRGMKTRVFPARPTTIRLI